MPFSDHHRHIDGPLLDTRRVTRRLAGTEIAVNEAVSTYLAWKLGEVVECESVSLWMPEALVSVGLSTCAVLEDRCPRCVRLEPMEPSSDDNALNGANLRVEGLERCSGSGEDGNAIFRTGVEPITSP